MTAPPKPDADTPPPLSDAIRDSAQQIWQAGLGAFAKAQAEGSKAFEALVKEGGVFQRHAPDATAQGLQDAARRMASMAEDMSARATGQWDKLENIFEQRVAKALQRLGVPSSAQVQALEARIAALEAQLRAGASEAAPPPSRRRSTQTPDS